MPLWINGNYFVKDNTRVRKEYNFTFSTPQQTLPKLVNYYANVLKWREPKFRRPALSTEREQKLMALLT